MAHDYKVAESDDIRRHLLLKWGFDKAHAGEVTRLFGSPEPVSIQQEEHKPVAEKPQEDKPKLLIRIAGFTTAALSLIFAGISAIADISTFTDEVKKLFDWLAAFFR